MSTANKLAQTLRHSKSLKTPLSSKSNIPAEKEELPSLANISRVIYERPLRWKISLLSFLALFLSSNVVSGFFQPDSAIDTAFLSNDEVIDFQPTGSSGDGFLVKPALQTSDGERTGVNDIVKYTVKSGDTISRIAARFNVSSDTILAVNNMGSDSILREGKQLLILPVDGLLYTVQKDDTLDKIAKKYNVVKEVIVAQNKLSDTAVAIGKDIILPGAKKIVIDPSTIAKSTAKSSNTRYASLYFNPADKNAKEPPAAETYNGGFDGKLTWPVAGGGKISQRFSYRHPAVDITYGSATQHPSIVAADNGVVVQAEADGWNGGYGRVIVIDHGNGVKTRYAHNNEVYVSVGDHVSRGQVIAKMGNTGRVYGKTGIHSHFEVIVKGKRVNPLLYY